MAAPDAISATWPGFKVSWSLYASAGTTLQISPSDQTQHFSVLRNKPRQFRYVALTGLFYNKGDVCSLTGTNRIFKYNSFQLSCFKRCQGEAQFVSLLSVCARTLRQTTRKLRFTTVYPVLLWDHVMTNTSTPFVWLKLITSAADQPTKISTLTYKRTQMHLTISQFR